MNLEGEDSKNVKKENNAWKERLKEDSESCAWSSVQVGGSEVGTTWYWNVNQHPSLQKAEG